MHTTNFQNLKFNGKTKKLKTIQNIKEQKIIV